jgi:3-oxoacyl-[acyl-carrier-protein] synthase II
MKFAITGLGLITPLGNDVKTNWRRLVNAESAVDYDKKNEAFIARVKGFDIDESKRQDAMANAAILEALSDAGFADFKNASVVLGESKPNLFKLRESLPMTARYGVSAACATGAVAIIKACGLIANGTCKTVICGCAETSLHPLYISAFKKMGVLSKNGHCPFDKNRDGFALGEGAGFIVIENYENALKRGAKIYCEIAGFSCAIFTDNPVNVNSSDKMSEIIKRALKGRLCEFIHAHGTGTRLNDYYESKAVFESLKNFKGGLEDYLLPFITSTKAATGHLLGVSAMAGAIFSILTIRDGIIAPTLNFRETDIAFGLNYAVNKKRVLSARSALSLSWGFGGQGAAIFFKC